MTTQFQRVVVCVCTCKRPKMLAACLRAVAAQTVPDDLHLSIVVVDNEAEPNNRAAVLEFGKASPFAVIHCHEPRRGIAAARNAALTAATDLRADWLVFIDDDEIAEPDWLAALMAPDYRHLPILGGHHSYQFPDKLPFWMVKPATRKVPDKLSPVRAVGAGNMRIRADVILAGVRFDERYGLLGGEDTRFCLEAESRGFATYRVPHAVTRGPFHAERMTYRGIVTRHYAHKAALILQRVHAVGWGPTCARELPKAALHLLSGAVVLLACPLGLAAGLTVFKKLAVRGGKHMASGLSYFAAMSGRLPQPYRHIAGH